MGQHKRPEFAPLRPIDGYVPIEDHGLIGDGSTAALVARDGAIDWLCVPRFDSRPVFCRLLDAKRGGAFLVAPEDLVEARQYYDDDTAILITELRSRTGLVRITDALTLRSGANLLEDAPAERRELLRSVQVLEGTVRLRVEIEPWGGATASGYNHTIRLRLHEQPSLDFCLTSSRPLDGPRTAFDLSAGECIDLLLHWARSPRRFYPLEPDKLLKLTRQAWRQWLRTMHYQGPQAGLVRRSAVTLKLLDYFDNGSMIAAPTSSLPERIGGSRNWDYRYTWVRDAAYTVYALHRLNLMSEAAGFLGWVLDIAERDGYPRPLYSLDGKEPPPECEEPGLEGYRGSRPVRWGNAAAVQIQNDVFGEVLDSAFQWSLRHGAIEPRLWSRLRPLVNAAAERWCVPDHGIWEVRTGGRPFTYSAALCHVALNRGARLARRYGLKGNTEHWEQTAFAIVDAILHDSWDHEKRSLVQHVGGGSVDASLLALSLRRVLPFDHPKMIATVEAIRDRLSAGNGLLFRYVPQDAPDGVDGHEGAFVLCSFWLVDNLAGQGRLREALDLYQSLCDRTNHLGLLPEEIDPATGAFLGNFPQAFSHVGLISSGVNIARAAAEHGIHSEYGF